jgi:hypothetical protein
MEFSYKFHGSSAVAGNANRTDMSFAPDVSRDPTFFNGVLGKNIAFREAMSALHHVVVSDLRFKAKDKSQYKEWAAQNETALLGEFLASGYGENLEAQIKTLREEMSDIAKTRNSVLSPYYNAQKKYFDYLYQKEKDFWFVLDPVITVHPDEIFFECFSQDESSYGRLGCSYEVFKKIDNFACGTTNIDYSAALYNEFQKIREYKDTSFVVDPSGFQVQTTNEDNFTELKIDLPDSWVRGFLQVSSAMTLPTTTFDLHPMDVHNICHILRRQKEQIGPRSIRFILTPGKPVELLFEPWNHRITCARSIYNGTERQEVRIWGRRRLLILERLIAVTQRFTVHLLGSGLPSFFIADMGYMSFTLGLSGWTANDWSRAGNFDLMAPRTDTDNYTKQLVFNALKENWFSNASDLAARLNIDKRNVEGALASYTQAGRVIYDMNKKVYRVRELSQEPLPMEQLRFDNPREAKAHEMVNANKVKMQVENLQDGAIRIQATIKNGGNFSPSLTVDKDERIVEGHCTCNHHYVNKLFKGPCEHILAARIQHQKQNWWTKFIN